MLSIFIVPALAVKDNTEFIAPGTGCNFVKNLPAPIAKILDDLKGLGVFALASSYVYYMLKNYKDYMAASEEEDAKKKKKAESHMFGMTVLLIILVGGITFGLSQFSWYGSC